MFFSPYLMYLVCVLLSWHPLALHGNNLFAGGPEMRKRYIPSNEDTLPHTNILPGLFQEIHCTITSVYIFSLLCPYFMCLGCDFPYFMCLVCDFMCLGCNQAAGHLIDIMLHFLVAICWLEAWKWGLRVGRVSFQKWLSSFVGDRP